MYIRVALCIIFVPTIKHEDVRDLIVQKVKYIKMETKIIYQVEKTDLVNLFNEIIQQREQAQNSEVHLTLKEAMIITKKSRGTLWKWEQQGYLKPVRVGKSLYYLKSDIDSLMNQKRS